MNIVELNMIDSQEFCCLLLEEISRELNKNTKN